MLILRLHVIIGEVAVPQRKLWLHLRMFTTTGEPSRSHWTVLYPRSCRRPQGLNLGHKTNWKTGTWERSVGKSGSDGEKKKREHGVKMIRMHYIHARNFQREIELNEHWLGLGCSSVGVYFWHTHFTPQYRKNKQATRWFYPVKLGNYYPKRSRSWADTWSSWDLEE